MRSISRAHFFIGEWRQRVLCRALVLSGVGHKSPNPWKRVFGTDDQCVILLWLG